MAAVGCLPNAKVVVWMQTVLYFAAAVLGFFITIPMGVLLVSWSLYYIWACYVNGVGKIRMQWQNGITFAATVNSASVQQWIRV